MAAKSSFSSYFFFRGNNCGLVISSQKIYNYVYIALGEWNKIGLRPQQVVQVETNVVTDRRIKKDV